MYRSLPVWVQWALPFGVAAVLVVALIAYVNHETNGVPQIARVTNKRAIVEQNREDTIIVRQQQAPRVARLKTGESAEAGLGQVLTRYMNHQISRGAMAGPIKNVSCHAVAGGSSARQVLRCNVTAADLTYPFDGVVSRRAGAGSSGAAVATYCQRVAPPIPSMNVPVSPRCT